MAKLSKTSRFLAEHHFCCLCGGEELATTIDHIPPKACFPVGYCPDTFEFPSCSKCNNGTAKEDLIFGLYSQILDFSETKGSDVDRARIEQLRKDIGRRYPEAMPCTDSSTPIYRVGSVLSPHPVAYAVPFPRNVVQPTIQLQQAKLTHALYYRETGKVLTKKHSFTGLVYQLQGSGSSFTDYLNKLLPEEYKGIRINICNYGSRFMYKFGYKDKDDFFMYAVQFRVGLIVCGLVFGESAIDPSKSSGPLQLKLAGYGPNFYRDCFVPFIGI
jgi:hypothetical protein